MDGQTADEEFVDMVPRPVRILIYLGLYLGLLALLILTALVEKLLVWGFS